MSIAMLCSAGLALGSASTPDEEEGQTDLGGGSACENPGGIQGGPGGTSGSGAGGAIRGGQAAGAVVGTQDQET